MSHLFHFTFPQTLSLLAGIVTGVVLAVTLIKRGVPFWKRDVIFAFFVPAPMVVKACFPDAEILQWAGVDFLIVFGGFAFAFTLMAMASLVKSFHADREVPAAALLFQVAMLILMFAACYSLIGIVGPDGKDHLVHDFGTCLYFSIMTLTTVGYGDFSPSLYARPIAALQALSGYFIMALLISFITARLSARTK